jgi:hypothetical protein
VIPHCSYFATPVFRCHLAGKAFQGAQQALQHARQAAEASGISHAVYRVQAGRSTLLWRFDPAPGAA